MGGERDYDHTGVPWCYRVWWRVSILRGSGRSRCGSLTESSAHKSAASLPVVQTCETYLLPTVAALNLQVHQTCIPPVVAESLMANTRRSKLKPWKTKPIQVTPDPQLTLVRNPSLARERLDRPTRNRLKGHRPLLLPISLAHPRDPLASLRESWRD